MDILWSEPLYKKHNIHNLDVTGNIFYCIKFKQMKVDIILGTSYGDEGKGRTTDRRIQEALNTYHEDNILNIRFSGGHQAGHNVVDGKTSHIFSNFGCGTLYGVSTYWSKYCTFYPVTFLNEYTTLTYKVFKKFPKIYVDAACPVCTPFDVQTNQEQHVVDMHGSCGLGVGNTFWRHETIDHAYQIYVADFKYPWILEQKLIQFQKFFNNYEIDIYKFIEQCVETLDVITIVSEPEFLHNVSSTKHHLIFEGSQGILLDRDHGIFPHCTRSNTTSKNAMSLLSNIDVHQFIDIWYISRVYQTRHGEGPLLGENIIPNFRNTINNPNETNIENPWQGKFRYAPLSLDCIKYAMDVDSIYHKTKRCIDKNIVFTCLDQIDKFNILIVDNKEKILSRSIESFKPIQNIYTSSSPELGFDKL